jgi:predicted RNase H-like HicB family nuclease
MVANLSRTSTTAPTITYPIVLEEVVGGWIAMVPGWSESKAIGLTREAATAQLQQALSQRLVKNQSIQGELAQIEINRTASEANELDQMIEFFVNDPTFDDMLAEIERQRQIDREAYFRELDEAEAAEARMSVQ